MLRPVDLKAEYMSEPMGLSEVRPRLFWKLTGSGTQSAYRIQVKTDRGGMFWDSGRVESEEFTHIRYSGRPLRSRDRVIWRVKVWDDKGQEGSWSREASFELGLLEKSDWEAWWITGDYEPRSGKRYPADCFMREFRLTALPEKGRLYLSACGVCQAYLNGTPVGDGVLTPGWTDYKKRIACRTFDVAPYLRVGTNRLELVLGDGWFRGRVGYSGRRCAYGKETRVLAQMELFDRLGDRVILGTDRSFRWSRDGETGKNDLRDGETAWCGRVPTYSGTAKLSAWPVAPECTAVPPIRIRRRITPAIVYTPGGKRLFDFGENVTAMLEFRGRGGAGQKITVRVAETLDDAGEPWFPRHPASRQILTLNLSGNDDIYRQRFSFAGFRYALLDGLEDVTEETLTALVISSAEPAGEFVCSDERISRFVENVKRSMAGAFLDVPVADPAGRRLPLTGDALAFFETSLYFADAAPFWEKWMKDLSDAQREDGSFPVTVPAGGEGVLEAFDWSPGRSDAGILIPWMFWKHYQDGEVLMRQYPSMRRCAQGLVRRAWRTPLWAYLRANPWERYTLDAGITLGETLEPEEESPPAGLRRFYAHTEEGTAYLAADMTVMEEIAALLGHEKDTRLYREYAQGARKAYRQLFLRRGMVKGTWQGRYLRALKHGLLPPEAEKRTLYAYVRSVRAHRHHAATGLLSTGDALTVLSRNGYREDAYRLLLNPEEPGWMDAIARGATSVWGNWYGRDVEGRTKGSFNRCAMGAAAKWLVEDCAGIRVTGNRKFLLAPGPGGGLTHVKCRYDSIWGAVSMEWTERYGGWSFEVTVPVGTTADLRLPDGTVRTLPGGSWYIGI